MTDRTKCWRGLGAAKRQAISYGVPSELFISDNQELAEFIEEKLHRYIKSLEKTDINIKLLQIVEGNGGAGVLGPFRVGLNFIVFVVFLFAGRSLGRIFPKECRTKPTSSRPTSTETQGQQQ